MRRARKALAREPGEDHAVAGPTAPASATAAHVMRGRSTGTNAYTRAKNERSGKKIAAACTGSGWLVCQGPSSNISAFLPTRLVKTVMIVGSRCRALVVMRAGFF